jgi:hypothetical protein
LEKDPLEQHNAINDKQYTTIIQKMKSELLTLKKQTGDIDDEKFPEFQKVLAENWN